MISEYLALVFASLFAGAAFYINFAEQPARLLLSPNSLLKQWAPSYKRGFAMQATLAVLSGAAALYSYSFTKNWMWIIGAGFILMNWPYTLLVIMPTNHKLIAVKDGDASSREVELIIHWGKLHAVRTGLGFSAVIVFLIALAKP